MSSLRRQLTKPLFIGVGSAILLSGGILYASVSEALLEHFDQALVARANALTSLLEVDDESEELFIDFDFNPSAFPEYLAASESAYFEIWLGDGTPARRSENLGDAHLALHKPEGGEPLYRNFELPDGRAARALWVELIVKVLPEDGDEEEDEERFHSDLPDEELPRVWLSIACPREELNAALALITGRLLIAALIGLGLGYLAIGRGVRGGLKSVERLGDEVGAIDAAHLSTRLATEKVPSELQPVVARLNELLERIQAAFERQKRMTAAMAHELRSASDVAQRWPEDSSLRDDTLATAADVAARMGDTIDAVMRYCRLEAGQVEAEREPVPLRTLLDELWQPYAKLASQRGVHLENELPQDVSIHSDRGLLSILFSNLLGNAASFAGAGSVQALVSESTGRLEVQISNSASDLSPEDLAHISEPFWRKDAARTGGTHSGLGLALVAALGQALGHSVNFRLEDQRFTATVGIAGV